MNVQLCHLVFGGISRIPARPKGVDETAERGNW